MLLLPSILLLALFLFYHTQMVFIVYETAKIKYRRIKTLKNLVATQSSNIFSILYVMLKIILKTFYINLCQYFNQSVRMIDRHTYEISYVVNGILYKMVVKPKRGPKCIIEAVDEDDNDLTHLLISYVGPMENFHGHHITPKYLKKKKITLNLSSGDEKTFEEDEIIAL